MISKKVTFYVAGMGLLLGSVESKTTDQSGKNLYVVNPIAKSVGKNLDEKPVWTKYNIQASILLDKNDVLTILE